MEATLSQRGSTGQPSGQAAGRVSSPPPPPPPPPGVQGRRGAGYSGGRDTTIL